MPLIFTLTNVLLYPHPLTFIFLLFQHYTTQHKTNPHHTTPHHRHGQSEYNAIGRIGGDSGLSTHGVNYARKLADFVEDHVSVAIVCLCVCVFVCVCVCVCV